VCAAAGTSQGRLASTSRCCLSMEPASCGASSEWQNMQMSHANPAVLPCRCLDQQDISSTVDHYNHARRSQVLSFLMTRQGTEYVCLGCPSRLPCTPLDYCSQEANFTSGSFRAPENPSLGLIDLLRFTLAPSVATQEAADTCASAAEPAVPEARQAGEYTVTAAPAVAGQWQLIRNSEGQSIELCMLRHSRA
jgi:hypothetical protein